MNHSSRIFTSIFYICAYNLSSELISYDSAIVKEVCLGVDTHISVRRKSQLQRCLPRRQDCKLWSPIPVLQQISWAGWKCFLIYDLNLCPLILILLKDEVSTAHRQLSVTFIKASILEWEYRRRWINCVGRRIEVPDTSAWRTRGGSVFLVCRVKICNVFCQKLML